MDDHTTLKQIMERVINPCPSPPIPPKYVTSNNGYGLNSSWGLNSKNLGEVIQTNNRLEVPYIKTGLNHAKVWEKSWEITPEKLELHFSLLEN